MKKFSGIYEEYKEDLLRNKLDNKSNLFINIKCDFCNFQDEYKCENNVADREERWLAVESFIENGWNELITPEEKGIACPTCIDKWKEGDWYIKESFEEDFEEDFDEKIIPKIRINDVKMIDVGQWDKLVSEVYGKPYSFQQQEGCKPRGIFRLTIPSKYTEDEEMHDRIPERINGETMGVKFKVWLEQDPDVTGVAGDRLFWARNFYPDVYTVANDLYENGYIEAGKYIINIDW